jgi:hypothetical protein
MTNDGSQWGAGALAGVLGTRAGGVGIRSNAITAIGDLSH